MIGPGYEDRLDSLEEKQGVDLSSLVSAAFAGATAVLALTCIALVIAGESSSLLFAVVACVFAAYLNATAALR